jgi:hypothetical protein
MNQLHLAMVLNVDCQAGRLGWNFSEFKPSLDVENHWKFVLAPIIQPLEASVRGPADTRCSRRQTINEVLAINGGPSNPNLEHPHSAVDMGLMCCWIIRLRAMCTPVFHSKILCKFYIRRRPSVGSLAILSSSLTFLSRRWTQK